MNNLVETIKYSYQINIKKNVAWSIIIIIQVFIQ